MRPESILLQHGKRQNYARLCVCVCVCLLRTTGFYLLHYSHIFPWGNYADLSLWLYVVTSLQVTEQTKNRNWYIKECQMNFPLKAFAAMLENDSACNAQCLTPSHTPCDSAAVPHSATFCSFNTDIIDLMQCNVRHTLFFSSPSKKTWLIIKKKIILVLYIYIMLNRKVLAF